MDNEKKLNDTDLQISEESTVEEALADTEVQASEEAALRPAEEPTAGVIKEKKLRSAFRLKYGTYATAITAIFIALIVLINAVVSVVCERYPLTVDFTTDKMYTVNEENIEFIKGVDYKVKLSVLFSEENYTNASVIYNTTQIYDATGGNYLKQTADLLKQYNKYNKNITVEFLDATNQQVVSQVLEAFEDVDTSSLNYGDILVECYVDGEVKAPRRGIISLSDCYELESEDDTGYYEAMGYAVTQTVKGNNIEQAVANGIFKTANLTSISAAVITANSNSIYVEDFKKVCADNAITLETCGTITNTDFSKYDVMIICAPIDDYTTLEIKAISQWLENDGKKGKTLLFFASATSPDLPNLYAFLEDWGIAVEKGYTYYSKDSRYYSTDRTNIYLESMLTDYTSSVDNSSYGYIANYMVPISAVYEAKDTRSVEAILQTSDMSTYKKPIDDSSWEASGAGNNFPAMMISKDEYEGSKSNVIVCSSADFLTNSFTTTKSDNGNYALLINVLNNTSRNDEDKFVMETKVLADTSGMFTTSTTNAQNIIIAIIFVGLIPLGLIATAIFVYIRRKNY